MGDERGSWTRNEKLVLASIVVAILIGVGTWLSSQGNTITQPINDNDGNITNQQGTNNTHIQNQTINIGLTPEEYEERLKLRETEVRTQLEHTHAKDRQGLELESSDIQQQLQDTKTSYENYLEKGCILLGSRIETPIEVKKGVCFLNKNKNYQSDIRMITRNAIIYLNYTGKEITCFLGDTCSFGWPNSPKFHVNSSGYPDEKMYISNAD